MSKSKPSTKSKRFWYSGIGGAVLVLAIGLGALAYRPGVNRVIARGDALRGGNPRAALVYYQAADAVSAASPELVLDQAEMWLALNAPDRALEQAKRAGTGPRATMVRSRAELELGMVSVEAAEATKALMAQNLSKTALAAELQVLGLLRTSQRVLQGIPEGERSPTDYLLLAKADIHLNNLVQAQSDLEAALKRDITNIETHKLYKQVLQAQGKDAAAEDKHIHQLEDGKV